MNDVNEMIDTMFEHGPIKIEEVKKLISRVEGTEGLKHLIAVLVVENTRIHKLLENANERLVQLEELNQKLDDAFENMGFRSPKGF